MVSTSAGRETHYQGCRLCKRMVFICDISEGLARDGNRRESENIHRDVKLYASDTIKEW